MANALYRGVPDLLLLTIDTERCTAPARWEDLYGSGQELPHVYGPIEVTAVVRISELVASPGGAFERLPE